MRYLIPLAAIFLLVGCTRELTKDEVAANAKRDEAQTVAAKADQDADVAKKSADLAREKQIAQASSNLAPIADAVRIKGQSELGQAIVQQKSTIDSALTIPATLYPVPTVTVEKLINDIKGALSDYKSESAVLQKQLDEKAQAAQAAQVAAEDAKRRAEIAEGVAKAEKEKADAEARKAWWVSFGTGALGVLATLSGIAARLGLPGGAPANAVLGLISPLIKRRSEVAESAVAAADVARQGLGLLETYLAQKKPELQGQLSGAITELTGGKADGLNSLFKTVAKGYSTDHHGDKLEAIDSLLTELRGKSIATQGGVPTALQHVIKQA